MNTLKYIFALCFLFLVSCELEREDYTEIYPENFFKTENDLQLAVNSLYKDFSSEYSGVYSPNNKGYQTFTEMSTDALWCTWGWEWDELHYQQWYVTMGANLPGIIHTAFTRYNYLSKARNMIRNIESSPIKEEVKEKYIAEAKALTGWMGLFLYDIFGPVPVAPDEVLDNPTTFVYLPRLSEEEYDKFMESNLIDAINNLPNKATAKGRMTKGAARMILLKYYLIKGYFDKAESLSRDLLAMEGNTYDLQTNYNYIFSKEGMGNNEIILQIPCNVSDYPNYLLAHVVPADYPWPAEKATVWGAFVIPWEFYDTFDKDDIRRTNIIAEYTNKKGIKMERGKSGNLLKGALPLKYGVDPEQTGVQAGIDIIVYRFSDVLLTLAECINRNEGAPTTEAISLVNRVRTRAGLKDLTAAQTASKEAFNEAILSERGHEFYLEGLRRQDLIRFGKYVEKANQRIDKANASGKNYFKATDIHNRFWIPQGYIDESKGAIKQNGYER
ncbi:RagB/SusD family nutrient uptake outer membrane protein [Bacteroides sp. GM023]|uniref:RagB/SusD family nutrient uptake outer membrane protein n=1 Tax=Bacteroides sp. GM023 TaxID=2723058 RepID=UPI00168B6D07|nr:RagB/SusD family nutrient uptake outer membrane protein [Bacteroides sp. GM023]MBD3588422.1 RagB/SusD family nutrient uptake outer membrane protein [Bacteroides sp. GM023]